MPAAERADRTLAVLIDAKRADLYVQAFDAAGRALTAPAAADPADLDVLLPAGPLLLAGDAVEQAAPALRAAGRSLAVSSLPGLLDAADLAALAARLDSASAQRPRPLYLRAPDVTLPGTRRP